MTDRGPAKEIFGQIPSNSGAPRSVHRVTLKGGGLTAKILTWGAVLQDLRLDQHSFPLVLGFEEFDHYLQSTLYFGATVGRFANRIGNAGFTIDGKTSNTDPNFLNKHTLHGGSIGLNNRLWSIADLGTSHVDLVIRDPDGTMGFPGNCDITCSYVLKDDGVLHISYTTKTDAPTIAGLAHHSYFILDDSNDCRGHELQAVADHYLPVNEDLIPTGQIADVSNTAFDFRTPKFIGNDLEGGQFYDHNFCVATKRRNLQRVAELHSHKSGLTLTVATTEPGLQFYDGHKINTQFEGLDGRSYGAYSGLCLETQNWPDAPNHEGFPDAVVRSDKELRQVSEYKFTKS